MVKSELPYAFTLRHKPTSFSGNHHVRGFTARSPKKVVGGSE
jgi:hypothetical protein